MLDGFFDTHKIILGPMAGVTDMAMRAFAREAGAQLTYTEMVSAKGLSYANEKTRHLLDLAPGEDLVAVQIFGHEPDVMAREAAWISETMGAACAYIDINMGCPARKIVRKGDGSALMEAPELAAEIVRAVAAASGAPVTVKMRRGYREGCETAPELAKRLVDAGACAVAVHGRFAEQMYRGHADWGVIARVKDAVDVPVIGNGDVVDGASAQALVAQTRCDAVMVARAACGNPWVFSSIAAAFAGGAAPERPTAAERIEQARRHARLLSQREGRNIVRMRKHASWYVAGMPGAAAARDAINHCATLDDFEKLFDDLEKRILEGSASHAARPV